MTFKGIAMLSLLSVVSLTTAPSLAEQGECSGSWEIAVRGDAGGLQSSAGPVTWLQAEVMLEDQLAECIDFLLIGPGNSTKWQIESGFQSLQIEPYDSRRNPLYISEDGRGWVLPLRSEALLQTFLLRVDHPQDTRPGTFQGIIQSEAWVSRQARQPVSQQSSLIEFVIAPYVALYFDGVRGSSTGSYFRVDLGELTTGASRQFDMFINSNSDVTLEIESENNSKLVHALDPGLSIPYDFILNNQYLDLRTPKMLNLQRQQQGSWRVPLSVQVPYVSRSAREGEYSDTISIDIYPRE